MAVPQEDNTNVSHVKGNTAAFAKLLAGNDKKIRDKGLKKLKKWLSVRSMGNFVFTEEDVMSIWIGLYYSMWMSDMPLVQEELAESLSSLIHCFDKNHDAALLFIKCFHVTMNQSWLTLDQYRIDKFSMLVRRFLRQSLAWLANQSWPLPQIRKLMKIFSDEVLAEKVALGLKLHFMDIFLEELAKVSNGELTPRSVICFLKPFVRSAATTRDGRVRLQLDQLFRHLIKQTDVALEYEDKFEAWKQAGFPGGDINLVVPDTDEEEGEDEEAANVADNLVSENQSSVHLDPRAGSVHVMLPQIQLPSKRIIKILKKQIVHPQSTVKGKKMMKALCRHFRKLNEKKYPYAMGKVVTDENLSLKQMVRKSAKKQVKNELKRKTKSKKKLLKKRKDKLLAITKASEQTEETSATPEGPETPGINKDSTPSPKSKIAKRKREEPVKEKETRKKRKTSTSFEVSEVPQSPEEIPIGARKRKNSDEPAELELPPGWIVDSCEETPQKSAKNSPVSSWAVQPVEVPISNDIVATPTKKTPKNASPSEKATKISSPIKETPKKEVSKKLDKTLTVSKENGNSLETSVKEASPGKENSREQEASPIADSKKSKPSQETEIVIESPKRKTSPPAFFAKAFAKAGVTPKTPTSIPRQIAELTQLTKSGRRISFNLARNMAQEKAEYFEQLERSPQIPFDGTRQPRQSALKAGLSPSPINPFYARKLRLKNSFS